jgi:hypothetical protein
MNMQINRASFDADGVITWHERKSLLRFIVCGSVDHGKSMLIGRLLYESGLILSDQFQTFGRGGARDGVQNENIDFSLILDGLAAEREQKITIDVVLSLFRNRASQIYRGGCTRSRTIYAQHGDRRVDGRPRSAPGQRG